MSHCLGLVVVPKGDADVLGFVGRSLEPYQEKEMPTPHKHYLPDAVVAHWRSAHPEMTDRELATWRECEWDDVGFYDWSTVNPMTRFDYWLVGGVYDGLLTGSPSRLREHQGTPNLTGRYIDPSSYDSGQWLPTNTLPVAAMPDEWMSGIAALVTLDGAWHDFWDSGFRKDPEAWGRHVKALLNECPDCLVVAVDYHS